MINPSKFALFSLFVSPVLAIFPESGFGKQFKQILDVAKDELDIDATDGKNLRQEMTEKAFLRSQGKDVSIVDILKYLPLAPVAAGEKIKCSSQSFGTQGLLTDLVCETRSALVSICDDKNNEQNCDSSLIPEVLSAKASFIQDSSCLEWSICMHMNNMDNSLCEPGNLPMPDLLKIVASGIQVMVSFGAPDGVETRLFTASENEVLSVGTSSSSPLESGNDYMIIGDGNIAMKQDAYTEMMLGFKNSPWLQYDVRLTVVDTLVHQYTPKAHSFNKTLPDEECEEFYTDAMRGYFIQRYGDQLFDRAWKRIKTFDSSRMKYRSYCATALGVLAASKCAYDADGMYGFLSYYFEHRLVESDDGRERFCSNFADSHFMTAKRAMLNNRNDWTIERSFEHCLWSLDL